LDVGTIRRVANLPSLNAFTGSSGENLIGTNLSGSLSICKILLDGNHTFAAHLAHQNACDPCDEILPIVPSSHLSSGYTEFRAVRNQT
jgi:hypothetical protein